jgi:hypothetical protein
MARGSAADFLIRTVLDEAFRELALADPQRAFEGYDLSEEEQEILRSRDDRLLGLLGEAAAYGQALVEHPAEDESAKAAESSLPTLPEVKLLLQLVPHSAQQPDSPSNIAYAASLHPWPGDHNSKTADAESGERTDIHNDPALPGIAWIIRITPTVLDAQEDGLKVAYAASIHPLGVGAEQQQQPTEGATRALAGSVWNHQVESSAAKAAARAVRASDASQRYEKLLELIQALQTGDDRG